MATYVVGDLQGCIDPLYKLLEQVSFSSQNDHLWVAGDIVNRGPESLATLRFIKQLEATIVLGNHDLHLLAAAYGEKALGKKDTVGPILEAPDRTELLDWLHYQPLVHHDAALGYTMVHAGIPPMWSVADALRYAAEVQAVLQSSNPSAYFSSMYGDKPSKWDESLTGPKRWRIITNYFTRMRFCTAQGKLELSTKTGPEAPPQGYAPWYSFANHRCRGNPILFGHWASLMGNTQDANFIALDTGCVWGGALSMIRLEDGARFSVDCGC